jgi:hypothetical protein
MEIEIAISQSKNSGTVDNRPTYWLSSVQRERIRAWRDIKLAISTQGRFQWLMGEMKFAIW